MKILNSEKNIKEAFLIGYNKSDGLKKNKCIYTFKNFKTNSAVLACGLIYLLKNTTNQEYNINIEEKFRNNKKYYYYSINILSNTRVSITKSCEKKDIVIEMTSDGKSQREISKETKISRTFIRQIISGYEPTGKDNKTISKNSVKKIIDCYDYDGWFYDLETESGTFFCGIGQGIVHNSPRRGHNFITRKITLGLGKILKGQEDRLVLGNIHSERDWGHARDYVEGMWLMLQQEKADDYVLATGKKYSVKQFVEKSFALKGFDIDWKGEGVNEVGYDKKTGKELIFIDPKYFRPTEVDLLIGDASKAEKELGWIPKTSFEDLVKEMVDHDCHH